MIATIFTLFLVTNGADVKHSTYDTLPACEEAKSLALWGKTVERKRADDAAEAKREADAKAAFDKAHPFHLPKTEQEKEYLKRGGVGAGTECDQNTCYTAETNGTLVRSYAKPNDSWSGIINAYTTSDIRTAECVIVPEAKP